MGEGFGGNPSLFAAAIVQAVYAPILFYHVSTALDLCIIYYDLESSFISLGMLKLF